MSQQDSIPCHASGLSEDFYDFTSDFYPFHIYCNPFDYLLGTVEKDANHYACCYPRSRRLQLEGPYVWQQDLDLCHTFSTSSPDCNRIDYLCRVQLRKTLAALSATSKPSWWPTSRRCSKILPRHQNEESILRPWWKLRAADLE